MFNCYTIDLFKLAHLLAAEIVFFEKVRHWKKAIVIHSTLNRKGSMILNKVTFLILPSLGMDLMDGIWAFFEKRVYSIFIETKLNWE